MGLDMAMAIEAVCCWECVVQVVASTEDMAMAIEVVCCWVRGYFLVVHTPNPHHTTTVRFSLQGNKASSTQLLIGVLVQFFFYITTDYK